MNREAAHKIASQLGLFNRIIYIPMILIVVVIAGMYLFRPLYDPDFYWHLKTGEWIWQHKALPHTDLFGIPPAPETTARTEFINTSYWLIQLILYFLYAQLGLSGIILFRWLMAGILLFIYSRWVDIRTSEATAVVAIGTNLMLEYYFIERPQFISFICFGALLVLLFRFLEQCDKPHLNTLITLSVIMLVWANMHGGFLIGQAIIIYFITAEGLKFIHPALSPLSVQKYKTLVKYSTAALLASFINPNIINQIKYLPLIFDSTYYVNANNIEELSLLSYYQESTDNTVFLYAAAIILTFSVLLFSRHKKNLTWGGIIVGTAFMGYLHMRLMPFFLVAALLFVTECVATENISQIRRIIITLFFIISTGYCISDELPRIRESLATGWVPTTQFPVKAADFLHVNKINGNLYTTMHWGGYLIWRVGPDSRVFYDNRTLNVQRAWEYDNSRVFSLNQRPYWKGLFNTYNIQIVVLPIYEDSGETNLLTESISADNA